MMKTYFAIGLMSGTSLDGLDICYVKFTYPEIQFEILQAETIPYSEFWKNQLKNSLNLSGEKLTQLDSDYGFLLAESVVEFIERNAIRTIDFIASHGHTVFHNPKARYTLQIGNGAAILAQTGIKTVYDFRIQDVLLGGQGAPLVPIGDELLFGNYDACLNLGGFSNISFRKDSNRIAFDICPVNIVLNSLTEKLGKPYDANGEIARNGQIHPDLVAQLNQLDFYQMEPPKSLGIEWCHEFIYPILKEFNLSTEDLIASFTEHIALQLANVCQENQFQNMLVTGGGAYNHYLIESVRNKVSTELDLPDKKLIEYKEALIFALMGMLKVEKQINVYQSVTGASKNHSSGIILE